MKQKRSQPVLNPMRLIRWAVYAFAGIGILLTAFIAGVILTDSPAMQVTDPTAIPVVVEFVLATPRPAPRCEIERHKDVPVLPDKVYIDIFNENQYDVGLSLRSIRDGDIDTAQTYTATDYMPVNPVADSRFIRLGFGPLEISENLSYSITVSVDSNGRGATTIKTIKHEDFGRTYFVVICS